jgi:hydantoinase/carbamoylase family amidase
MVAESPLPLDAGRVIADLRELDRLTGGPEGARRVAWTPEWQSARGLLTERLAGIGLEAEVDEAGNLWATLAGSRQDTLLLGSHLDSVPHGGWLDGALGVFAALEVLRALAASDRPTRTVALVDWADEEGARFGISLLGSSALSGRLDPAAAADVPDADGVTLREAMSSCGVQIERAPLAAGRREQLLAYLELHIEQGPVLEQEGLSVAAVTGTVGIERHRFHLQGQSAHAGTTPMHLRRDAGLAAAELALELEQIALARDGRATAGALRLDPGIPTAVAGAAELTVDLRHADREQLAAMLEDTTRAATRLARARGCTASREHIWSIDPVDFDPALVELARAACREVSGSDRSLRSGALHDAAELAGSVPAAMVFCASRAGISHAPQEDSAELDIAVAVEVFGRVAAAVIAGAPVGETASSAGALAPGAQP